MSGWVSDHTYKENKLSDFLKSIVKEVGNEYASIVEDGVEKEMALGLAID